MKCIHPVHWLLMNVVNIIALSCPLPQPHVAVEHLKCLIPVAMGFMCVTYQILKTYYEKKKVNDL